ncbi:MAG: N-acetyl-gamma-glutamyl-phosphate reductase [Nitrospirota bacterium]|nr:MAG: N-acetyl-gamma-glutamyl-phosphate reductase [Nitrospirota bacterium]
MLKVAICGGSGYTGGELLRILSSHSKVKVTAVTSERSAGKKVTDLFPSLYTYARMEFEPLKPEKLLKKADLFFLALPHAASQEAVDFFYQNGKKVIDLSADYRLHDPKVYSEWYSTNHNFTNTLKKAVYGLPELHRGKVKKSSLVANPGCYPTSAILGLYPVLTKGLIKSGSIIIDSKSGTSGAGRKGSVNFSYCEVNEGFKAYGIAGHRHTPEIEQEISLIAKKKIKVNFTPHLLPVNRGILSTIYVDLIKRSDTKTMIELYKKIYGKEAFVKVLDENFFPNIKNVAGTNFCEIGLKVDTRTNKLIIVSAIDNLIKGASGQAVQNMNIIMGFKESEGLDSLAVHP